MTARSGLLVLGVAVITATVASCGSSPPPPPPWHEVGVAVPATIGGYTVQADKAAAASLNRGTPNTLLTGASVYGLRRGKQLFAVLEIGDLKASARSGDPSLEPDVAGQLGQSIPRPVQLAGHTVYEGTAPDHETVFSWFSGERMMVLLVHGLNNAESQALLEAVVKTPL